jgi:hypothetical protein
MFIIYKELDKIIIVISSCCCFILSRDYEMQLEYDRVCT